MQTAPQPSSGRLFLNRSRPPHIVTLILLSGLAALSMNVFLPSLPGMAAYFEADYAVLQLSVALYLLVNAILQVLMGPVSDKMGRRPVIMWGIGLFLLATLGCILAPTAEIFLAFRMAQSVVAVTIVLSRAAVGDMYEQGRAASMLGYVTMGVAVVPMIGPAIGGALEETFGWQASFWMLFGLGLAALGLTWADFGETKQKSGLTMAAQFREYPELFRSPRFWGYSLASGLASGAFFAYLGGAPYVGTEVFGMTPGVLGIFFGAPAVGYFAGNFISGRYSSRIGVNRMVLWGSIINCLGVALNLATLAVGLGGAWSFFGFFLLVGVGNGMAIPNATAGAIAVRPHLAGSAAGLSGALMPGLGAGLSAAAGALLVPGSGAWPLLWLMLGTASAGVAAIVVVVLRERQLGL
ncbi:MAG TPA: Bcr/CflA family drug resistance efflux transporter [Rhodobacteraceae bacterium]|nr:Bcr/CflA family drug resistance efflux transporter [Paracoccaceae bacterium]